MTSAVSFKSGTTKPCFCWLQCSFRTSISQRPIPSAKLQCPAKYYVSLQNCAWNTFKKVWHSHILSSSKLEFFKIKSKAGRKTLLSLSPPLSSPAIKTHGYHEQVLLGWQLFSSAQEKRWCLPNNLYVRKSRAVTSGRWKQIFDIFLKLKSAKN